MEWLAANYGLLRQAWLLWFVLLFVGIVAWAFWPGNRRRLEAHGRIPLDDRGGGDCGAPPQCAAERG
jgi:cytochrome c oxidase cbb3-type subunit 4